MPEKTIIDYDKENDDLFIFRERGKIKGSVDIGDFIIDFSPDGKVLGMEIMNASSSLSHLKISKQMLGNIKRATIRTVYKPDAFYILLLFVLENNEEIRTIVPIPAVA